MNRYILCDLSYNYPNQPDIVKSWVFRKDTLDHRDLDSYGWSIENNKTIMIRAKSYDEAFLKVFLSGELFCDMDFKKLMMVTNPQYNMRNQYLLIYDIIIYFGLQEEIAKIVESKLKGEALETFKKEISNDEVELNDFIYISLEKDQKEMDKIPFYMYIFQKNEVLKKMEKSKNRTEYIKVFEDSMISVAYNLCDNLFKIMKRDKQNFLKTYGLKNIIQIHRNTFQSMDFDFCQKWDYTEYLDKSDFIFL